MDIHLLLLISSIIASHSISISIPVLTAHNVNTLLNTSHDMYIRSPLPVAELIEMRPCLCQEGLDCEICYGVRIEV